MVEIDKDNLEKKITVLDEDIQKVSDLLVKLEKDKANAISDNERTTRCQVTMCHFNKRIT